MFLYALQLIHEICVLLKNKHMLIIYYFCRLNIISIEHGDLSEEIDFLYKVPSLSIQPNYGD